MRLKPRASSLEQPRPGGRPRSLEPGAVVSTWLKPADHDRLITLARQSEQSVSALVRQLVTGRRR